MVRTMEHPGALLHCLLDMAESMLSVGAEVNRVEGTLSRMGRAYGAARMNVFVITSSVVVTMVLPDGTDLTQTRRITGPGGTDFTKLEALNTLSRRCCEHPLSVEDLSRALAALDEPPPNPVWICLGSMLAAGSFAAFFGGGLWDALVAAVFGMVIFFLQQRLPSLFPNKAIFNLVSSLLTGTAISLCGAIFPILQPDKIMIGDIMLLIPGIAMTNSVRDVLVGDTISGIMRLIETLLWAGSLAMGFMLGIYLVGG